MFTRKKARATSYLYDLRFILYGYVFGKLLTTQVSLCKVVGNSMHPTLQHSTSDVVLLWHGIELATVSNKFRCWRDRITPIERSAADSRDSSPHAMSIDRGAVYVAEHPTKHYKVIKRVIGVEGDTVFLRSKMHCCVEDVPEDCESQEHTSKIAGLWQEFTRAMQVLLPQKSEDHQVAAECSKSIQSDIRSRSHQSTSISGVTVFNEAVDVPRGHVWLEGDNQSISEDSCAYGAVPVENITAKAIGVVWPPSRMTTLPEWDVSRRFTRRLD